MTVSRSVCLGFFIFICVGTFLLVLPWSTASGDFGDILVALFTSTSAICVTGLVVVDTGTYFSEFGQAVIMILIQLGGLGYMTATSFMLFLLGKKFSLKDKVSISKSMDSNNISNVKDILWSIILTTIVIESCGAILLMPVFVPEYGFKHGLWQSVFHSISAFNNAGFSLFPDNLMKYAGNTIVVFVITFLIISGGIGYQVITEVWDYFKKLFKKEKKKFDFSFHSKVALSVTCFLLIAGTFFILLFEYFNIKTLGVMNFYEKFLASWFQSVTPRTAGFNTVDIGALTMPTLMLMIVLMFIGASPGGTGGGIKTTTTWILYLCIAAVLKGRDRVVGFRRTIPESLIFKAVAVFIGSLTAVIIAVVMIATSCPDVRFRAILFEVVSAFGTVGLSTGITAALSDFSKIVLIIMMYLGRVSFIVLVGAFVGDPKPSGVKYPEEELLV